MASSGGANDGDIGFQIAPMVDVVFVLMLFFMASAGSQRVEKELNINLPNRGPSNSHELAIIIDISASGVVLVNDQSYGQPGDHQLSNLREWLSTYIETYGNKDSFLIRPNSDAKHERIVDVLNAASASKVKNLTFS